MAKKISPAFIVIVKGDIYRAVAGLHEDSPYEEGEYNETVYLQYSS